MGGDRAQYPVSDLIAEERLFVGDGYRAKNSELSTKGIPFARAGNIKNGFSFEGADCFPTENLGRAGNKVSQPGDVVFTSKGTVGRFAFVQEETPQFVYSPQLCFWRSLDHELIDPRYLFYWISGREFFEQFKAVSGQTDMAEYVSLTDQRRMTVTLPSIDEQRTIAHILGTLDDKIELNRRMNETLEAMARALFTSWFVDFDPVRAKIDGRWRRGESLPGLPAHLYDLFPDRLVSSELGEIPEGWGPVPFLDLAQLLSGGTPKTSVHEYWNGGIKWASAKDVSQCGSFFLVDTERTITTEGVDHSATKMIPADSVVVVARGATCGRFTVFAENMAMNQTCYALAPRVPQTRWYLRFLADLSLGSLVAQAHGSVFDTITTATFERATAVDPGEILLEHFESTASKDIGLIRNFHYQSKTLEMLRDTLLPLLLSGEVSFPQAEQSVEAAV